MSNGQERKEQLIAELQSQVNISATISERIYRGIGESINYGIWICDPNGKNTYASESFLKLVGLTQEECSEYGWGKILHPDDLKATFTAWQKCVQEGTFWERTHKMLGVDGQWHYILARGLPIKDDNGEILCWAGINLDVDQFKKTEEALRESEVKFRQMADAMPQIVWMARSDGYLDYYNKRWYDYTGFEPSKKYNEIWKTVLHPDDVAQFEQSWANAVRLGQPHEIEVRLKEHTTGKYRWHLGRALPVHDENNHIVRWFGTCTDIDEQKQTETELATLAAIVQYSYDPIIGHDLNGVIQSWNASAERLYGYTPQEMIGRHISILFVPQFMSDLPKMMFLLNQGQVVNNFETAHLTKDNSMLSISITSSPIKDRSGEIVRTAMMVRNLTEKKFIERERAKLLQK